MSKKFLDINDLKKDILKRVAKKSFEFSGKQLDLEIAKIPDELIEEQGNKYYSSIEEERNINYQRVRLAKGLIPLDCGYQKAEEKQMVHVIGSACKACPIDRFTVTNKCRNCLTKACVKACRFDAIDQDEGCVIIDKDKCKKCSLCMKACPYNAIVDIHRPCVKACPVDAIYADENNKAVIDETKCINCGHCILACPFGAIDDKSYIVNIIQDLKEKSSCYAMIAPSIEGQFGDYSINAIKKAIKKLGFKDCFEVALGADVVAYKEAKELYENYKVGIKMTTSCCPSFVNMVEKFYPELKSNVSTTISPMAATAKIIKEQDKDATIVFIGPCYGKKNEVVNKHSSLLNYAITFIELEQLLKAKLVEFDAENAEEEHASTYGKGFAKSGGVLKAGMQALKEQGITQEIKVLAASGAEECKKGLTALKRNQMVEDFMEGMICIDGCIGGPAMINDPLTGKRLFNKYAKNGKESITETVRKVSKIS